MRTLYTVCQQPLSALACYFLTMDNSNHWIQCQHYKNHIWSLKGQFTHECRLLLGHQSALTSERAIDTDTGLIFKLFKIQVFSNLAFLCIFRWVQDLGETVGCLVRSGKRRIGGNHNDVV